MAEGIDRLPRVYLYLDSEGIESLYAQTTDRVETELTESRTKEGRGGVGLKVGFGNLLTGLLGLKEVAADTKLEMVHSQIEQAKSRLSIEHKLQALSKYMIRAGQCLEDLTKAAESASEPGQPIFIQVAEKFDAPDFFAGKMDYEAINSSKAIVFTRGGQYEPSDSYFKKPSFRFTMPASLEKFPRLKGFMGITSHEAIAFRGFGGKNIPLGIFGYLIRYKSPVCQIKPYAIWLTSGRI
jgi:hypothetical protein